MNAVAAKAREAASHLEVKKDSLRQTQDGLWKITLTAAELPAWLLAAAMGTRMVCALVQIGDDEQPVSPAEPPKRTNEAAAERAKLAYATAGEREKAVTRAAMLCGDPQFVDWICVGVPATMPIATELMRQRLGVKSRGEISSDDEAYRKFIALELEYRQAHGLEAEIRG